MLKFIKSLLFSIGMILIYIGVQLLLSFAALAAEMIKGIMKAKGLSSLSMNDIIKNFTGYTIVITLLSAALTLLIYILIYKARRKSFIEVCRFRKIQFSSSIYLIMLSLCCGAFSSLFIQYAQKHMKDAFNNYENNMNNLSSSLNTFTAISVLALIILLPVFEEILFRGIVFNELNKNLNAAACIILSSFLFGLSHMNLIQGIYTFFLGIILASMCYLFKSINASIIVHVTFNLSGTFIFPVLIYSFKNVHYFNYIYLIASSVIFIFTLFLIYKDISCQRKSFI